MRKSCILPKKLIVLEHNVYEKGNKNTGDGMDVPITDRSPSTASTKLTQSSPIVSNSDPNQPSASNAKRGRKRKQEGDDDPIKETKPRRKPAAPRATATKSLMPPSHVNPPLSSQSIYHPISSRSNLQPDMAKLAPRAMHQPHSTSTVKLVKSDFYEPKQNKLPLFEPKASIDDLIKWPDDSVLSPTSKALFKIWTAKDDYLLVTSFSYVENIQTIFFECEFSRLFMCFEIEDRLHSFFCDPVRGDLMRQRINKLDAQTRMKLNSKIPFSEEAIAILSGLPSSPDLDENFFMEFLVYEQPLFGLTRTAADLKTKWEILRNQNRLKDQQIDSETNNKSKDDPSSNEIIPPIENFDDIAKGLNDISASIEENSDTFFNVFQKHFNDYKLEFSPTDFSLPYPDGISSEDDCQHIASLRYGDVVYTIEMPSTIIGCGDATFEPNVDLKPLGESDRISAKQVVIEYDEMKQFSIKNLGKFPIFINGKLIITEGKEIVLPPRCVIKFDKISMIFRISKRSVSKIVLDWNLIKISD